MLRCQGPAGRPTGRRSCFERASRLDGCAVDVAEGVRGREGSYTSRKLYKQWASSWGDEDGCKWWLAVREQRSAKLRPARRFPGLDRATTNDERRQMQD